MLRFPILSKFDGEDELDEELQSLRVRVRTLLSEVLARDLVEISNDIEFLEVQLRADFASYSAKDLERANQKISHFKQKAEVIEIELRRRDPSLPRSQQ
ncbi:MAG: hypothetical protein ACHQ1H_03490 [Nitrososphaerales archaeon]